MIKIVEHLGHEYEHEHEYTGRFSNLPQFNFNSKFLNCEKVQNQNRPLF